MSKFLDDVGLGHLISKIKTAFVQKSEGQEVQAIEVEEVAEIDIDKSPIPGSNNLISSGGVYNAIALLPRSMVFQGTIGTNGTVTEVPANPNTGDLYRIIEGGQYFTFPGIQEKVEIGDSVVYKDQVSQWIHIPIDGGDGSTVIHAGDGLNTTSNDSIVDGGTITSSGTLYLTKTGVEPGTYQGIQVDKYGRVITASNQNYGTYTKPSGGIPESHFAQEVRNKLNSSGTFNITYGTTLASEIDTALAAGKSCVCMYSDRVYVLNRVDTDYYWFTGVLGTISKYIRINRTTDEWDNNTINLEDTSNKVSSIEGYENDTTRYPSCKAIADALKRKADYDRVLDIDETQGEVHNETITFKRGLQNGLY